MFIHVQIIQLVKSNIIITIVIIFCYPQGYSSLRQSSGHLEANQLQRLSPQVLIDVPEAI